MAALTLLLGMATGALLAGSDGDGPPSSGEGAGSTGSDSPAMTEAGPDDTAAGDDADDGDGDGDGRDTDRRGSDGGSVVVGNSSYTASYQSNSDRSIEPFDIGDGWEIRWEVDGQPVTLVVRNGDGETIDTIEAAGRGARTFQEGGTYQIDIDTDGSSYGVVVTDGP